MCHHEVDDSAKRRAVKSLLEYQILGFGLYQLMQVLRRTSGSFVGDFKQVKGMIHVSNTFYATSVTSITLWLGYSLPLLQVIPTLRWRVIHFTCYRSHLLPFRSQNPTVLPDFDIQDNYAQPHVQIRRSQYRKISHNFRTHTVQTRIPHLYSRF